MNDTEKRRDRLIERQLLKVFFDHSDSDFMLWAIEAIVDEDSNGSGRGKGNANANANGCYPPRLRPFPRPLIP